MEQKNIKCPWAECLNNYYGVCKCKSHNNGSCESHCDPGPEEERENEE